MISTACSTYTSKCNVIIIKNLYNSYCTIGLVNFPARHWRISTQKYCSVLYKYYIIMDIKYFCSIGQEQFVSFQIWVYTEVIEEVLLIWGKCFRLLGLWAKCRCVKIKFQKLQARQEVFQVSKLWKIQIMSVKVFL